MKRETKDQYFLKIARLTATRSTCPRRSVGCVIINQHNHVIATGYNGVPKGFTHCIDMPCGAENFKSGTSLNKCMAIHAEQNALLQCKNIKEIDTIYVTTSPCETCCKLIANTSCKRVVFDDLYSQTEGLELLKQLGIQVIHERIKD